MTNRTTESRIRIELQKAGYRVGQLQAALQMIEDQTHDQDDWEGIVHNSILEASRGGDKQPINKLQKVQLIKALGLIGRAAKGDEEFESIVHNAIITQK